MTNLDSTLKGADITLSTKVHLVEAMVFPVVMYGFMTLGTTAHQAPLSMGFPRQEYWNGLPCLQIPLSTSSPCSFGPRVIKVSGYY